MKYPALKDAKSQKQFVLENFDRGINDENGEFLTEDSALDNCFNMRYKDGTFKTRNGISAKLSSVIGKLEGNDTVYFPFTVTDVCFHINGKPYNIAYCCTGYSDDALLRIFLVDSKGNITSASSIDFHRLDYSTFNVPVKLFFLVGKKGSGNGVFLFVKRVSNNVPLYEIYEATEGFSSWINAKDSAYVPTVLINGRGSRYSEAAGLSGLNYPEPAHPEGLNLLFGKYNCYYSSDGLSSIFRLPYGNLNEYEGFSCKIYTDVDQYVSFNIPMLQDSVTQTILNESVTMCIDRTLGVVRFYSGNNNYCVPVMQNCKTNNIQFTAFCNDSDFSGEIISSKGTVTLNNRIYVYGNDSKPNCIYCSNVDKPLYFPQNSKLFLGEATSPVTALKVQNGKLIAFKTNETYRITTSLKSSASGKETVLPDGTLYTTEDTMSAQTIDTNIGCLNADTIRLCGSRLVWLATDGNIYALATTTYGNTTNIYRVCQPLGLRLKDKDSRSGAFAVTDNGEYILVVGKTAFVMNYRVRGFGYSKTYYSADDRLVSPAWFIWNLPEGSSYIGGQIIDTATVLVSSFDNGLSFYLNTLNGNADSIIKPGELENTLEFLDICSGFTTKKINFGSDVQIKRLNKVFINGKSDSFVRLTVSDNDRRVVRKVRLGESDGLSGVGSLMPLCQNISAELFSEKPFFVRNIIFKYKLIGDKG